MSEDFSHALAHHRADQLELAKLAYEDFLLKNPVNTKARQLLGICLGQMADHQAALHHLTIAVEQSPNDPSIHNALGNIQKHLKRFDAAIAHYHRALALMPSHVGVLNNLGIIYMLDEQYDKAAEYFDQAIKKNPTMPEPYFNAALNAIKQDHLDDAMIWLKHCLDHDNQHLSALCQLGQIHHQKNQYIESCEYYQRAYHINKNYIPAMMGFAQSLIHHGDDTKAKELFLKVLEQDPNQAQAHHNLGSMAIIARQFDDAIRHWLAAHTCESTADSAFNVAMAYQYAQRFNDALIYFKQSLQLEPNHLKALNNIAAIYLRRKQYDLAISTYEQLLNLDPDHVHAAFTLQALGRPHHNAQEHYASTHAPLGYIQHLFDEYALCYDQQMTTQLEAKVPTLIASSIDRHVIDGNRHILIDLGCGTGLTGQKLSEKFSKIIGIDASQKMLDQAQQKHIYCQLIQADVLKIDQLDLNIADVIVAGDVCPYIGDLRGLFKQVHDQLTHGGYWIFSVESCQDKSFILHQNLRYAHQTHQIESWLIAAGFIHIETHHTVIRVNHHEQIKGAIIAAKKPLEHQ